MVTISASMSNKRMKNERLGAFVRSIQMRPPGKAARTHELPQKLCPVGRRRFAWRKKWECCWEEVVYCSRRCRREGKVL